MKCIVFGAGGYLGRNLTFYLRQSGDDVVIPHKKEGERLDLLENDSLIDIDWNVDVVFMYAGVTGTATSFDSYKKFLLGNELALLNMLDAIRRSKYRPKIIFPSTRLVYAESLTSILETDSLDPKTIYAVNKIACENYLKIYQNSYDIPSVILRICVPYGNIFGTEYSYGTIGSLIKQAKNNKNIELYGTGDYRRTFTHIDDISRLTRMVAVRSEIKNLILNIPGENFSLLEVAKLISEKMGVNIENISWPSLARKIESGNTVFDGQKLLNTLDTCLRYSLAEWIDELAIN